MLNKSDKSEKILILIRKMTRAIDLHSKQLVKQFGLTGPQMLLIKIIINENGVSSSQLASIANLSHPTVTSILDRLAQKGYVTREKDESDRRKVIVYATQKSQDILAKKPLLLQEDFVNQFCLLKDWEQSQLIYSLERISDMMSAQDIDASPFLISKSDIQTDSNT